MEKNVIDDKEPQKNKSVTFQVAQDFYDETEQQSEDFPMLVRNATRLMYKKDHYNFNNKWQSRDKRREEENEDEVDPYCWDSGAHQKTRPNTLNPQTG